MRIPNDFGPNLATLGERGKKGVQPSRIGQTTWHTVDQEWLVLKTGDTTRKLNEKIASKITHRRKQDVVLGFRMSIFSYNLPKVFLHSSYAVHSAYLPNINVLKF